MVVYFSPENLTETNMTTTARSDPAIPERNQGAETISNIGIRRIPINLFAINQSKAAYVADPIRKPNRAKESINLVLPNDIVRFTLHLFMVD